MRYIIDNDGYIMDISFVNEIVCDLGECTGYNGEVPDGYETLEEWYDKELEKLNAWKIVDGNLEFDNARYIELEEKWQKENNDNKPVLHKDIFELEQKIDDVVDMQDGIYLTTNSIGKIIDITNVKKCIPKIKITDINCYDYSTLDFILTKKNMLLNTASSKTISGITFTQNEDRSITINGKSTEAIEYNISGTNNNVSSFLCFKKNKKYYLSGLSNITMKMYNFDGTDRTEIYSGTDGLINFTDGDKSVTQVVLSIPNGTTIDNVTIYPQLEYSEYPTEYEPCELKQFSIDFSEFIGDGIFPSNTLFPSDTLFPLGTKINYILLQNNSSIINVNGLEQSFNTNIETLFNEKNIIYTIQDTNLEIEYCINELYVDNLDFMRGKETTTNKFKVLEDGSIEAHNGKFSGDIYLTGNDSKIIGGDGLLTSIIVDSNIVSSSFVGGSMMLPMGYSNQGIDKDRLEFQFTIPKGFKPVKAYVTINHMATKYGYYNDSADVVYKSNCYSRNLRLYKSNNFNNGLVFIDFAAYSSIEDQNINYQEVSNAFGSNGFTGNASGFKTATSIDIVDYISYSKEQDTFNKFKIETADGTFENITEMYARTGCVNATLTILGYTNFE